MLTLDVEIARPGRRPRFVAARDVAVDSVEPLTWIDANRLRAAGIPVRKRLITVDGRAREVGYAMLRWEQFETVDEVVFAAAGDRQILGRRALEGFNAIIDFDGGRLLAAGPRRGPAGRSKKRYRTPGVSVGRCLVGSLDNVEEVLDSVDDHRLYRMPRQPVARTPRRQAGRKRRGSRS